MKSKLVTFLLALLFACGLWVFVVTVEQPESEQTYYNYSNRYGKLRAYNNDTTDEDLDAYSQEVYTDKKEKGTMGLVLLAAGLLVGIVLVLGLFVLRFKGIL